MKVLVVLLLFMSKSFANDCYEAINYSEPRARGGFKQTQIKVCPKSQRVLVSVTFPIEKKRQITNKHFKRVKSYIKRAFEKPDLKKYQGSCEDSSKIEVSYQISDKKEKVCLPKNSVYFYEIKNLVKSLTYSKSYD